MENLSRYACHYTGARAVPPTKQMPPKRLSCGNLLFLGWEVETAVERSASESVYGHTERRATTPRLRYWDCDENSSGLPEHPGGRPSAPRAGRGRVGFPRNRGKVSIQGVFDHPRYRPPAQRRGRYCPASVCKGLRLHQEF